MTRQSDSGAEGTDPRPTAFISYAHGDDAWNATVLDFATALRTVGGIDADLDRWHDIGRQAWSDYGPSAIARSDVVLLALSSTFKAAWERTNPPDRNAGASREAIAVKGLFDRDQHDFQRRVKIVLLRDSSEDDIPLDLHASVPRFAIASFDLSGLEPLLRDIRGLPVDVKPALGPLPPLPPSALAHPPPTSDGEHAPSPARDPDRAAGGDDDDHDIASRLAARLAAIEHAASASAEGHAEDGAASRLEGERSALEASFDAVKRALTLGARRQHMVGGYLRAQLYLSAGAYGAAGARLRTVGVWLGDPSKDPPNRVFEPCMRELTDLMLKLTERMQGARHAASADHRHPEPPEMTLDSRTVRTVRTFYEVTRCAMSAQPPDDSFHVIRSATLLGRGEKHAPGLYQRFTMQEAIAALALGSWQPSSTPNDAGVSSLLHADLDGQEDAVAASALMALAKAHLELHLVERRRSGPVGEILMRTKQDIDQDRDHLRRSVVLSTFALAISESLPWLFAATEEERRAVQEDPAGARRALAPFRAMSLAREVGMLATYRRSHGFRLLGDHERSYNDLRILQRLGRLTGRACEGDELLTEWVDTLDALAEYRIGELYRADHDYTQALEQLCRSHDSVQGLGMRRSPISAEIAHLEIKLSLGKGKAYFETGAMKRSLKWHLTAWRWLLSFELGADPALLEALDDIEQELDRTKHDPVLFKEDVQAKLRPVVEQMCAVEIRPEHHARAADILVRISHLLSVLRLPEDAQGAPAKTPSAAMLCLERAVSLDKCNLFVQTGRLRYELRRPRSVTWPEMPDPMECWPSGASSVDQVIRVAEHLMLERLHAAGGPRGTGRKGVARALVGHFMTHTDSINLRGAILHRYLMRPRAERREPWWAEEGSDDLGLTDLGAAGDLAPYLEFVCLRRFGSFTPFMPRPAAVSAVGGGYLVRVARPSRTNRGGHPTMFNIIVDPGEGAVNNLYAMGLSIADIDMVIATHDHPEHLAALDAILSLRRELHRREREAPTVQDRDGADQDAPARLPIFGNRSVVNRYSFLSGDGAHLVQHITDASVLGPLLPEGVTIDMLPTEHTDAGGHEACGFVLRLASRPPESAAGDLSITFMSDTAIEGLYSDRGPDPQLDVRWERALAADIVVAHVSDVPGGELRELADLSAAGDSTAITAFDAGVRKLAEQHPADASQLMHALSLVPRDVDDGGPRPLLSPGAIEGGDQLYLRGLLKVCECMSAAAAPRGRAARVLIVGELNEQLGSFRGTIAREINARMLGLDAKRHEQPAPPLIALTADIGLRVRLAPAATETGEAYGRSTVLCSTCSYNNDRLDCERFHPPEAIYDVCVKGDNEAMFWNCDVHDPGSRERPKFVEQMGSYNPFRAGARFHA